MKRYQRIITSIPLLLAITANDLQAQDTRNDNCTASHYESVYSHNVNEFEYGDWVLIFDDEFNGSEIDTTKWYTCEDGWNRFHGECGAELQCYLDNNITISDGILRLVAKRDDNGFIRPNCNILIPYSSGWVQTRTKFKYGLIEARCKVPKGKGFWPAFWLFGHRTEIDVFEIYGNENDKTHSDMHNWQGDHMHCQQESTIDNLYDDYHVYRIEWDEFKIIYSVDGHTIREQYKYSNVLGQLITDRFNYINCRYLYALNIFPDSSQSIIFNLAISNSIDHPCPDETTTFPSSLDVDYIRVYKRNNNHSALSITSYNSDSINYVTGRSIQISDNTDIVIHDGDFMKCIATQDIVIHPDFHAEYGSEFSATIIPESNVGQMSHSILPDNAPVVLYRDNSNDDIMLQLYPNPTNGIFSLELLEEESKIEDVIVEDGCGRVVYKKSHIGEIKHTIALHRPGVYYVRVRTNKDATILKKLLVK